jgi:hypothetical protein
MAVLLALTLILCYYTSEGPVRQNNKPCEITEIEYFGTILRGRKFFFLFNMFE